MNHNLEHLICKVDAPRKLVFGWAQVCTKEGAPYYDTDNEHFPEDVTLDAWVGFMKDYREHKAMHSGESVGEVVFAFPAFPDILSSLGIQTGNISGMIVGVKVDDPGVLEKFHSGAYLGFSIGGAAVYQDEAE